MTNHPPPLQGEYWQFKSGLAAMPYKYFTSLLEAEAYFKMMQPEAIRIRSVIALKYFKSIHHDGVILKISTL